MLCCVRAVWRGDDFGIDDATSLPRGRPRRPIPEAEWQSRFDVMLQRLRAAAHPDISAAEVGEIEVEITAAREELRRGRAARR